MSRRLPLFGVAAKLCDYVVSLRLCRNEALKSNCWWVIWGHKNNSNATTARSSSIHERTCRFWQYLPSSIFKMLKHNLESRFWRLLNRKECAFEYLKHRNCMRSKCTSPLSTHRYSHELHLHAILYFLLANIVDALNFMIPECVPYPSCNGIRYAAATFPSSQN